MKETIVKPFIEVVGYVEHNIINSYEWFDILYSDYTEVKYLTQKKYFVIRALANFYSQPFEESMLIGEDKIFDGWEKDSTGTIVHERLLQSSSTYKYKGFEIDCYVLENYPLYQFIEFASREIEQPLQWSKPLIELLNEKPPKEEEQC